MELKEYRKLLAALSASLQDAYYSDNTYSRIKDAAILAKLDSNSRQFNIFTQIVTDILLGLIPLNHFDEELKKRLDLSDANREIISKVVQQKIFAPLKDDLNQLKINQPEFTFQKILQEETITTRKPLETSKETIKTEKIKELIQKQKLPEVEKTEVITKKEVIPDLSLPEIQEIQIERPTNKTGELKRVIMPSASPEVQAKIHSKLMEAMNKKEIKPKIVEEMKKVIIKGVKETPQQKSKAQTIQETKESITSQVIGGEGNQFISQEKDSSSSLEKPYIFDVRLKEEKEKKQDLPKEEIKYQKPAKKPFGEA